MQWGTVYGLADNPFITPREIFKSRDYLSVGFWLPFPFNCATRLNPYCAEFRKVFRNPELRLFEFRKMNGVNMLGFMRSRLLLK